MLSRIVRNLWLLAVVALEAVGLALLVLSFAIESDRWAGVMVEFGSTLIMFAPLVLLGRNLERRIDRVRQAQFDFEAQQEETASRVAALAEEVAHTRAQVKQTHDELSRAVVTRLAANRKRDEELFRSVEAAPSHRVLSNALIRASVLGLIATAGCRVQLRQAPMYLWFQRAKRVTWFKRRRADLRLILQRTDGDPVRLIPWPRSRSVEDILTTVGEAVQASGDYPGDTVFEPGRVFADLSALFEVALKQPVGPLVQLCPPQWAITSQAITSIDPEHSCTIDLGKIGDVGTYEKMIATSWLDRDSFDSACDCAKALFGEHYGNSRAILRRLSRGIRPFRRLGRRRGRDRTA